MSLFLRQTYNFSWFELISREIFQISNLKQDEIASNLQKIAKICPKPLRIWDWKSFKENAASQIMLKTSLKSCSFYKSKFLKKNITQKCIWLKSELANLALNWHFHNEKSAIYLPQNLLLARPCCHCTDYTASSLWDIYLILCGSCLKYQIGIIQLNIV